MKKPLKIALYVLGGIIALNVIASIFSKKENDTPDSSKNKEETKLPLSERLKNQINSLKQEKYEKVTDLQTLQIKVMLFNVYGKLIKEADSLGTDEDKRLSKQLKQKVIALQISEFPKMRANYIEIAKKTLWESDIEVESKSKDNSRIRFIGGLFAANRNIKQTQEKLHENLYLLRFKRSEYLWIPSADEYDYYDISSPKDNEIISE